MKIRKESDFCKFCDRETLHTLKCKETGEAISRRCTECNGELLSMKEVVGDDNRRRLLTDEKQY